MNFLLIDLVREHIQSCFRSGELIHVFPTSYGVEETYDGLNAESCRHTKFIAIVDKPIPTTLNHGVNEMYINIRDEVVGDLIDCIANKPVEPSVNISSECSLACCPMHLALKFCRNLTLHLSRGWFLTSAFLHQLFINSQVASAFIENSCSLNRGKTTSISLRYLWDLLIFLFGIPSAIRSITRDLHLRGRRRNPSRLLLSAVDRDPAIYNSEKKAFHSTIAKRSIMCIPIIFLKT
ncbi:hypothetical protein M426DRAFT_322996 [Hypoxylon sp. CI-4A]|nr:hypothetical protein M426DRAFT_322996 [Hypoxylon sp. CI-4A]